MFETQKNYPCAVADQDGTGERIALEWCCRHMGHGQSLTLWVTQKNILRNNGFLSRLSVAPRVKVETGRGINFFAANGPVLAMYPRIEDLGTIMSASGITALCVIRWNDGLSTWIQETKAEILHDAGWDLVDSNEAALTPDVLETLRSITLVLNHNNTITEGYEKKIVVTRLLRLHDNGVALPKKEMMEWASANGWRGKNVEELGNYVDKINNGVRPRTIR